MKTHYAAVVANLEKRRKRDAAVLEIVRGTNTLTLQIQARAGRGEVHREPAVRYTDYPIVPRPKRTVTKLPTNGPVYKHVGYQLGPLALRGAFPKLTRGKPPRGKFGRVGPLPYLGDDYDMLRRKPNPRAQRSFILPGTGMAPTGLLPVYHLPQVTRPAVHRNELLERAHGLRGRVTGFLLSRGAGIEMAEEIAGRTVETFTISAYKEEGKLASFLIKVAHRKWADEVKRRVRMPPMQQYSPLMDELGPRGEVTTERSGLSDAAPVEITGASWAAVQDGEASPGKRQADDPEAEHDRNNPWAGDAGEWTLFDLETNLADVCAEDIFLSPAQYRRKWDSLYDWEKYKREVPRRNATREELAWAEAEIAEAEAMHKTPLEQYQDARRLLKKRAAAGEDVVVPTEREYDRECTRLRRKKTSAG